MPPNHILIPVSEYRSLVREVKRGVEVCDEAAGLRVTLLAFARQLPDVEKPLRTLVQKSAESCEDVSRLRVELLALERRLREFDTELTPVRPPSRTDIQAAFENSAEFLKGTKKP